MGGRRNKSRKVWRSKVARVAKNVTLRNLETKRIGANVITNTVQAQGFAGTISATNTMSIITQGTAKGQRVGDMITLKGMTFKFLYANTGAISPNNTCMMRVSLFKIDPYLTVSSLTRDQFFIDGATAARPVASMFVRGPNEDTSIVQKTYFDKVFTFVPAIANVNNAKHFTVNVPMHNTKFKFQSAAVDAGDQFDIVLVVQAWISGAAAGDDTGEIITDYRIYWKDG